MSEEFKARVERASTIRNEENGEITEWSAYPRIGTLSIGTIAGMSEEDADSRLASLGLEPGTVVNATHAKDAERRTMIKRMVIGRLEGYPMGQVQGELSGAVQKRHGRLGDFKHALTNVISSETVAAIQKANRFNIPATALLADNKIRPLLAEIRSRTKLDWWNLLEDRDILPPYKGDKEFHSGAKVDLYTAIRAYSLALDGHRNGEIAKIVSETGNQKVGSSDIAHVIGRYFSQDAKDKLPNRSGKPI